jgi:glycosyltransferase involved in cell wall biosynthesis
MVAQTYKDIEIIVSDNASTDNTSDVVMSFNDSRIRYVVRKCNLGDHGNYKKVIQDSDADFLFITHDDDIVDVDYIERCMLEFHKDKNLYAVGSNVRIIDSAGLVTQNALYQEQADRKFEIGAYPASLINEGFWIPPSTLGIRWNLKTKDAIIPKQTEFSNEIGGNSDVYLVCLLNTLGSIIFLGKTYASYREHGMQMSMQDNFVNSASKLYLYLEKLYSETGNYQSLPLIREAYYSSELQEYLLSKNLIDFNYVVDILKKIHSLDSTGVKADFFQLVSLMVKAELEFSRKQNLKNDVRANLAKQHWSVIIKYKLPSLFEKITEYENKKIAIFGSMTIAALLNLEAKRIGIQIDCFIDGNRARVGSQLHGLEIFPHSHLCASNIDVIIISSEKEKFESIKSMLIANTQTTAEILCWKNLILD